MSKHAGLILFFMTKICIVLVLDDFHAVIFEIRAQDGGGLVETLVNCAETLNSSSCHCENSIYTIGSFIFGVIERSS